MRKVLMHKCRIVHLTFHTSRVSKFHFIMETIFAIPLSQNFQKIWNTEHWYLTQVMARFVLLFLYSFFSWFIKIWAAAFDLMYHWHKWVLLNFQFPFSTPFVIEEVLYVFYNATCVKSSRLPGSAHSLASLKHLAVPHALYLIKHSCSLLSCT